MSQLLGAAEPTLGFIAQKDVRMVPVYGNIRRERDFIIIRHSATNFPGGWATTFWPGGGGLTGDQSADTSMLAAIWRGPVARLAWGSASRVGFVGTTRDAAGGRLAGVTCSLFRTSDKLWIMDVVSDANGDFLLQSWYSPDTHFIVFAKSGAPDVVGTTRQTLVGA